MRPATCDIVSAEAELISPISTVPAEPRNDSGRMLPSLARINLRARIVLCGLIASYNAQEPVPGPYNFGNLLVKRAHLQGFIILDYAARFPQGVQQLAQWFRDGRLKHRETLVQGLQEAPVAINRLFDGSTTGKLLVEVAEPPLPVP